MRTLSAAVLAMMMLAATALAETSPDARPGFLSQAAAAIVQFMGALDFDPRALNMLDRPLQEGDAGETRE